MAGKTTAENAFGQVLICLRMSKLNYIVKETPYSAYVTIRKKFVKSMHGAKLEEVNVVNVETVDNQKHVERENLHLKLKVKEYEKECALLKFENEELEMKYAALEKEKDSWEDQIEEALSRNRDLIKTNEKLSKDTTNAKLERLCKENGDNIVILEFALKNRDEEIERLKNEISKLEKVYFECKECTQRFEIDSELEAHKKSVHNTVKGIMGSLADKTFACEECDFKFDNEECLRMHMKEHHEVECEYCNVKFSGKKKLKNHMCRNHVKNPSCGDLYMKNWFVKNACVRIFSEQQQKEVATLHSELCVENHSCSFLPSNFTSQLIFKDNQDLVHLPASLYFKENLFTGFEVKWETLVTSMSK